MTTYCLDPSMPFKAIYNLNTWTMPTDNIVFSHLTTDITSADTTIHITTWEGILFKQWEIATIEQLNSNWKVIAREVILIADIEDDELTIVRATEQCVIDDTASPKVLDNIPLDFTAWAKISVYVSRALLNWVQVKLSQVNCPCNTCVYEQALALDECFNNCCDYWRAKLYDKLACKCWYRCCVFGNGSDWDCVMSWNVYLQANRVYQFNNLTICSWACIRFEWQWVPQIRVRHCFINNGTIDMRWGQCTGACSLADDVSWQTISNSSCNWCPRCWGVWGNSAWDHCYWDPWKWCTWSNWSASWWWAGWAGWSGCVWCAASWYNGWNWWNGWWRTYSGWWGWWGWGWGWRFGNGWNWWTWWAYIDYWYNGWTWWTWWNAGYWWTGWNWWDRCGNWAYNYWWAWWNWYVWWNWTSWWNWGLWVIQWWSGWTAPSICWWSGWKGWDAVNNMFWLLLTARLFNNQNWKICSKWWQWWNGWNWNWSNCCTWYTNWWRGWNGANWGCVIFIYWNCIKQWTIDVSWWSGWTWWCTYACHCREANWTNWTAWSYKVCRFTY